MTFLLKSDNSEQSDDSFWFHPAIAAALFAIDPSGLQGILLRGQPGPARDQWLLQLRSLLPAGTPWRRLPVSVSDDRLLGGVDLSATLKRGRLVVERGLLAESHEGVLLLSMAERIHPAIAARLAAVLDTLTVAVERSGISDRFPARLGMIALDEGIDHEEAVPLSLSDRFAIHLSFDNIGIDQIGPPYTSVDKICSARLRLSGVTVSDSLVRALCVTATNFGIESMRAVTLAVRVARAAAALESKREVSEATASLAAQLVFASRASCLPLSEDEQSDTKPSDSAQEDSTPQENPAPEQPQSLDLEESHFLEERIIEATQASIPPALMQQLQYGDPVRSSNRSNGRSAARQRPAQRGRRVGVRPGVPANGSHLNLVETLRAAAPWQSIRRLQVQPTHSTEAPSVIIRREDFRVNRYQQRAATTAIFAVDASGSSALHRLAEAKGAVELLLADSYQRRDQVALVAFRGKEAELLLPPTRSLVRAKRSLTALPGGGGTPLAAGIKLALDTALAIRRKGEVPVIILLTDGRANITLDGNADRPQAASEALDTARWIRSESITSLLVDTSPRSGPEGRRLAEAMAAHYLALPHTDARRLTVAARDVVAGSTKRVAHT